MIHEAHPWVPREGKYAGPNSQPAAFSVICGMHLVSVTPAQSAFPLSGPGLTVAADALLGPPVGIGGVELREKLQRMLTSALGCCVVVTNSASSASGGEASGQAGCFWVECYAAEHNGELRRVEAGMQPPGRGPSDLLRLGLSNRESQVLYWIAQGKTNPEIAVILGIARRTVATHVEHILAKLAVENRGAAARCASEVLFG